MQELIICDVTLRDGNHALNHKLSVQAIANYCRGIDLAGVPIVEVGHGNGLGASSLQLGESLHTDEEMLKAARENLSKTKLGVHVIPGFATAKKDLALAMDCGVDIFRIASHCSEADITAKHIEYVRTRGKTALGVLMMSHMISTNHLVQEALKMESYGAEALIFMDSAGHFLPADVCEKVKALSQYLNIPVGFHAHNNFGMAVANSVAAAEAGAVYIDATARGLGAGSGNTPIEALISVLERMNYSTGISTDSLFEITDYAEQNIIKKIPTVSSLGIISGMAGVFSGFLKPVLRISSEFGVDPKTVYRKLGEKKVIAGQEDLIIEVAAELAQKHRSN